MKKIILNVICCFLALGVTSGCDNSKNNETSSNSSKKQFAEDTIINHVTINNVKLSEINTMNDAMEKLNAEIESVAVCYKETESDEGCRSYPFDKFESEEVEKNGISTLMFFFIMRDNGERFSFSTYYKTYKEKGNNSPYLSLSFSSYNLILLNNEYVENISVNAIKEKYTLSYASDYLYYINFESLDGDKYRYTGYSNSNLIEIFNYTERDREL